MGGDEIFTVKIMKIKVFNIHYLADDSAMIEINRFLSNHKVLDINQKFYKGKNDAYWCFSIRYLDSVIQNNISLEEGIPAYAIFTDEELSEMAKLDLVDLISMGKIKGIGEKKVSKYGSYFVM